MSIKVQREVSHWLQVNVGHLRRASNFAQDISDMEVGVYLELDEYRFELIAKEIPVRPQGTMTVYTLKSCNTYIQKPADAVTIWEGYTDVEVLNFALKLVEEQIPMPPMPESTALGKRGLTRPKARTYTHIAKYLGRKVRRAHAHGYTHSTFSASIK